MLSSVRDIQSFSLTSLQTFPTNLQVCKAQRVQLQTDRPILHCKVYNFLRLAIYDTMILYIFTHLNTQPRDTPVRASQVHQLVLKGLYRNRLHISQGDMVLSSFSNLVRVLWKQDKVYSVVHVKKSSIESKRINRLMQR